VGQQPRVAGKSLLIQHSNPSGWPGSTKFKVSGDGQECPSHMSLPRFGGALAYLPLATGAGASDAPLLGDQEILREGPIVIDPLGLAVETCLGGDLE